MTTASLHESLLDGLTAGTSLEDLERDVIDRAVGLDDEERAAAWLFAWHNCGQRRAHTDVPHVTAT